MAKKNNNNSDWMSRKQDEQTEQLEERLTALYANAENEIRAKWDDFMSGFEKEDTARRKLVESGSMPEDEYTAWRKTQILKSNQYSKAVESMSNMLVETDVAAMATVNDQLPQVVAESYDFVQGLGFQAAEEAGLTSGTFQIYNARTVQALIKDNPDLMPKPSVDIPEDQRWSKDRINREITQGIVQGESIPKIANRLRQVTTMDRNAAVRNARTAMTGAENLGRYQSAQDLRENGIPIEEVWMATPDDRTRESHRLLDGTTRDESGYFGVGIIDTPLRFAGDPLGAPEEVYNCRCRTGIVLQGIDHSQDGDLYAEFMRQFEDGKEMIDGKIPEAQSQHPEPEQKTAEEIKEQTAEENTVVALHITSEDNIEQILNNGFDLERAGTGAGSTWGDGAYFATGTDEKTFYQYRIGNENGIAAKIDTSDMLTVDLGSEAVKSPSKMYDMAAKQLTEDEYKEYKQHIKEQEATGSEAKRLAFEETVKDHYTGLIIQQDNSEGIDILTGGNQIVVYDTRAIEVLDKANVHDDLEQIATSRIEEQTEEKTYITFNDEAEIRTEVVGRMDFNGIHKEGREVQYSVEYQGDGTVTTEFFKTNTNNEELISKMSEEEKKDFKNIWSKGKFMQGQQYGEFSDMKPRLQKATRTFDKYLDQATINENIEVVRLSDAQLLFGAGNRTGSLEDFQAMKGEQITCKANMSFSAASEGLRINYVGAAPTVEYKLKIAEGSTGSGMYIGDKSINTWGDRQREFMTNRNIWMTVGDTTYDEERKLYTVEITYGGLMEHDYN